MAKYKNCKFNDKKLSISKFGLEVIKRDIGTGYNTPEGILIWFGEDQKNINLWKKQKLILAAFAQPYLIYMELKNLII